MRAENLFQRRQRMARGQQHRTFFYAMSFLTKECDLLLESLRGELLRSRLAIRDELFCLRQAQLARGVVRLLSPGRRAIDEFDAPAMDHFRGAQFSAHGHHCRPTRMRAKTDCRFCHANLSEQNAERLVRE